MFDPARIEQQIEQPSGAMPEQAAAIIKEQARKLAEGAGTGIGVAAVGGLLLTVYSATKGMKSLIEGLNIIYDEEESRGFLAMNVVARSIAFSIYVRNFGSYNETYGSIGAVVILLMWFWLSTFIVLMGAELNSEIEHQIARHTTDPPSQPMGKRGAHAADTLGDRR